jgi:hypothetical protein
MRTLAPLAGIAILLTLFAMSGCSDSNTQPYRTVAPSLPSINTMTMDISLFESTVIGTGALVSPPKVAAPTPFGNFANAAARAIYLKTVVLAASALPVEAFSLAAHSVPQRQPEGSWLWTYIFVSGTTEYDILLYGKPMDTYIDWRMVVSSNDATLALDHFLWFEGQMQNNRRTGYWQFYEPVTLGPQAVAAAGAETPGEPVIRVDWLASGWGQRQLTFLIDKEDAPAKGSTLAFAESTAQRSVVFYNSVDQTTGAIIWYLDGSGSIEWPDYNGGVKSCWNTLKQDVACR